MKLAMRLPEKNSAAANDRDPREDATTEVIDLASRTSYPAVANRKGHSDALGLAAGVGFVALLGAATLWGLNASRMPEDPAGQTATAAAAVPPSQTAVATPPPDINSLPSANAGAVQPVPEAGMVGPVLSQPPYAEYQPAMNPYGSPVLVFDAGAAPGVALAGGAGLAAAPQGDADHRHQGTMIPAVLETAINTDVPGLCPRRGEPGRAQLRWQRVLVPRSSRLIGQYQSGRAGGAEARLCDLDPADPARRRVGQPRLARHRFDGTTGLEGEVEQPLLPALRFGHAAVGDRRAGRGGTGGAAGDRRGGAERGQFGGAATARSPRRCACAGRADPRVHRARSRFQPGPAAL
jgi:type IV secretion system protein VirB10